MTESTVHGVVIHGQGMGRVTGYPTAKLQLEGLSPLLSGIYTAWVEIKGEWHPCLLIVGVEETPLLLHEVYVIDWAGDLYGKRLTVEIQERIGDIRAFKSRDELIKKIEKDVKKAKEHFKSYVQRNRPRARNGGKSWSPR